MLIIAAPNIYHIRIGMGKDDETITLNSLKPLSSADFYQMRSTFGKANPI
jgi:hypothetical protein